MSAVPSLEAQPLAIVFTFGHDHELNFCRHPYLRARWDWSFETILIALDLDARNR